MDLICTAFFFNPNKTYPTAFILALAGVSLPTIIMICLPRQDCKSKTLTLFRLRLTYEAVISWYNQLETVDFCLVELIESIAGGFPSALIQTYAILYRSAYESDTTFELLGPLYVLYISLAISVFASSWTSARLFTTNEERHCSQWFYALLFLYYGCEKMYRIMYFAVISLFLSSGGYRHGLNPYALNIVFLLASVLSRLAIVCYSHRRIQPTAATWEESWNFLGRLLLSLATSYMWVGEYILSCRFLLLEFFEAAFFFPFFLWLRRVSDYESHHFNSQIPLAITVFLYGLKTALLFGRLYFTPHARHVLYNHALILINETLIVLFLILIVWGILIIIMVSA